MVNHKTISSPPSNLIVLVQPIRTWLPLLSIISLVILARLISLPGLENRLGWQTWDVAVFYAYRFGDNTLFPNDLWGGYARNVYPFLSLVHLIPALLWRFAGVDPVYVAYIEVFITDLLLALAIYALSQILFRQPLLSLLAVLLGLSARVTNWNLANYGYLGSQIPYPGDMILPFMIFVLCLLLKRQTKWALLLTGALALLHPVQAVYMVVVVGFYLLLTHRERHWSSEAGWALAGFGLLAISFLPTVYLSTFFVKETLSREEWLELANLNQHTVPWLGWWGWQWAIPFVKWSLFGFLTWRLLPQLSPHSRRMLGAVGLTTLLFCLTAFMGIWLQIPTLMKLNLFRISTLFNLALLPLAAAYSLDKVKTTHPWHQLLIVTTLLTIGLLRQPPPWLLLGALVLADLARGKVALWSIALPSGWRQILGGLSCLCLLVWGAGMSLAYWQLAGTAGTAWLDFSNWLIEGAFASPLIGPWWFLFIAALVGSWFLSRLRPALAPMVLTVILIVGLSWSFLDEAWMIGKTQRSEPYRAWKATQDWARENTPLSATFIGLPAGGDRPNEWRVFSQRNLVDLVYRGYYIYLADRTLNEYDNRSLKLFGLEPNSITSMLQVSIDTQQRYRGFTNLDFQRIAAETGATYALIQKPRTLSFTVAYENDYFAVYDVTRPLTFEVEHPLTVPNGNFEAALNKGRIPHWNSQDIVLDISNQAYEGKQAVHLSVAPSAGQPAWFYSGDGELNSPPTEAAFQIAANSYYRIRSQIRSDETCRNLSFWSIEFDQAGQAKTIALAPQYFLDQKYIVNPHLYVMQVFFLKSQPDTVSFRIALQLPENPTGPHCQLEIDQVEMDRFETMPLTTPE